MEGTLSSVQKFLNRFKSCVSSWHMAIYIFPEAGSHLQIKCPKGQVCPGT